MPCCPHKLFTLQCFLCVSSQWLQGLPEPLTTPSQLNTLLFVECDLYGERHKLQLRRGRRQELSPSIRARANNFQISKQYIMRGLGVGIMPKLILCSGELEAGTILPVLEEWSPPAVDVYMLYPYQLSYSNLISAFYDTAQQIILENIAQSEGDPGVDVAKKQK